MLRNRRIREPYVRWCERSENESRKKTTSFSSYSILIGPDTLTSLPCRDDRMTIRVAGFSVYYVKPVFSRTNFENHEFLFLP